MDHLYGFTVNGIQAYIFQTNNLKEIIGASELIESICTENFVSFIERNKIDGKYLLNAAGNIRYRTSADNAAKIYSEFQSELLKNAPGVPFSQSVVEITAEKEAIQKIDDALRAQRNVPQYNYDLNCMGRMLARTTGDAAVTISSDVEKRRESLDAATLKKFALGGHTKLMEKKIGMPDLKFAKDFKDISKNGKHSWLALIHIDGNGMGNIIQEILRNSSDPFHELEAFSSAVEESTKGAFRDALNSVFKGCQDAVLPFRPLVLGGDDVTAIMRADLALEFCSIYLKKFEEYTKKNLLDKEYAPDELTACAGIAFVKEKFPFHYSANLAEELCAYSKKESNRDASCLMFHRVQDSFISDYEEILDRELTYKDGVLVGGPYYVNGDAGKRQIGKILEDVRRLRDDEDSPQNAMREWIDAALNGSVLADTLKERMENKYAAYKDLIDDHETYNDYLTLLSISSE